MHVIYFASFNIHSLESQKLLRALTFFHKYSTDTRYFEINLFFEVSESNVRFTNMIVRFVYQVRHETRRDVLLRLTKQWLPERWSARRSSLDRATFAQRSNDHRLLDPEKVRYPLHGVFQTNILLYWTNMNMVQTRARAPYDLLLGRWVV